MRVSLRQPGPAAESVRNTPLGRVDAIRTAVAELMLGDEVRGESAADCSGHEGSDDRPLDEFGAHSACVGQSAP